MANNPEKGNGWEVTRGFITLDQAACLGEQALRLIAEDSSNIDVTLDHPLMDHVSVYEAEEWDLEVLPDNPVAVYLRQTIPDILDLARTIRSDRSGPVDDKVILNYFQPFGMIDLHRDRGALDRSVVGLIGVRKLMICDPKTQQRQTFYMFPGDRADFTNPDDRSMRPVHSALCMPIGPSVSLVV